jgi:hypothetical protein
MVILRDDDNIAKLKKRGQRASIIGFLFLVAGFALLFIFPENQLVLLYQLLALLAGYALTQYGLSLTHRYSISPRPDEVLDDAVKSVARDGRMYHYLLPASHVLLTKAGPIVFVLKYQTGNISAVGDKWRQTGIGFKRFFGQEGLGNPAKDAEKMITALANYIRENAAEVKEVPVGAMIVFTSKNIGNLSVADSNIPAMHYSKVKGYLRQKRDKKSLPSSDYAALQRAFDEAATGLL